MSKMSNLEFTYLCSENIQRPSSDFWCFKCASEDIKLKGKKNSGKQIAQLKVIGIYSENVIMGKVEQSLERWKGTRWHPREQGIKIPNLRPKPGMLNRPFMLDCKAQEGKGRR